MNIAEDFAKYLESIGIATLGHDLFISNAPSSNKTLDSIWWIVYNGGSSILDTSSGESLKRYQLQLFYRDRDHESVYNKIMEVDELINCSRCVQLTNYDSVDISTVTYPIDNDLDLEDRKVGLIQVSLTIYKTC